MINRPFLLSLVSATLLLLAACGGDGAATTMSPSPRGLPEDPQALMTTALFTTFRDITATVDMPPNPAAAMKMGESGDERYIPVLIDMLGFPWLLDDSTEAAILESLSSLSGVPLSDENRNWIWWVEWLSANEDVSLPDGYAIWKGNLFTTYVDSRIGSFLIDAVEPGIRLEEVVWGGVVRDGIPDLQDPPTIPASGAAYLNPNDRVFGITVAGESRAYPLRILNAHEMANDVVGGTPIALAYCTLCGSGIAYVAEINGEQTTFGTSGLLYRANKLMYDRLTDTLWIQFAGTPVIGPLQEPDFRLQTVPLTLTTWADWRSLHPDTTVLDIDTGVYPAGAYRSENDPESQYYEYRANDGSIFPLHKRSDLLPEKSLVAGINLAGRAKAYPLDLLEGAGLVNDVVGGVEIVVLSDGGRAYERDGVTFVNPGTTNDGIILTDDEGVEWRLTEEALVSIEESSRVLNRIESRIVYWFAWFQFHPASEVYED
ncbi:MAG TPA: DUF3179 domain-containing protein [Dehalococcoidia bacterium]|nr:DUF3179 domain-containing protein [Dehalococcoidia bacterium]